MDSSMEQISDNSLVSNKEIEETPKDPFGDLADAMDQLDNKVKSSRVDDEYEKEPVATLGQMIRVKET